MKKIIYFLTGLISCSTASADHTIQYDIRVDGITCPFCVATSEKALRKIDGVEAVGANLETGTISVCADSSLVLEDEQLRTLFLKKGFTYRNMSKTEGCSIQNDAQPNPDIENAEYQHEHNDEKQDKDEQNSG